MALRLKILGIGFLLLLLGAVALTLVFLSGLAAGCCGGGMSGGSSGEALLSWLATGLLFCAPPFLLSGITAASWRWVGRLFIAEIALALAGGGIVALIVWNDERTSAYDEEQEQAFKPVFEARSTAVAAAFDTDDVGALKSAILACQDFVKTVPKKYRPTTDAGNCRVDLGARLGQMYQSVEDKDLHEFERLLNLTERQTKNLDQNLQNSFGAEHFALDACNTNTGAITYNEWQPLEKSHLLGAFTAILARHRDTPLRMGENMLQEIFVQALNHRRTDIAQAVLDQAGGRFRWCRTFDSRDGTFHWDGYPMDERNPVWLDGERLYFEAIADWPQEYWTGIAQGYLRNLTLALENRDNKDRNRIYHSVECERAIERILKTRPTADRAELKPRCDV